MVSIDEVKYDEYVKDVTTSLRIVTPSKNAFAPEREFVKHRFYLSQETRNHLQTVPYAFGFDGFGEAVYYRTYSRLKVDNTQENWVDTVIRVVEGVFSIRKDWYVKQGLPWNESYWQDYAKGLAIYFIQMKWLPPGRGLWAMGTDYIYQRGAMALYNCAATKVDRLSEDFAWLMDLLMCGCGVGIECIAKNYDLKRPSSNKVLYIVPDTREGWVESVRLLFESYENGSEEVLFDYGLIRDAGKILHGMGGVSAGADPLIKLHNNLRNTLNNFLNGKFGATRLVADCANHIGICVVVGNVRRSSEILIGEPGDEEFLQLKNYDLNPDRAAYGWMSNNTIRLSKTSDFEILPRIAERVRTNGEPGFMNLMAAQKFARFGREKQDKADLQNPCQPGWATVLTPEGVRTFDDISEGSVIWSGKQWTTVVKKVMTGEKEVKAYKTRAGTFYGTPEHRVMEKGKKVEVRFANYIDVASCSYREEEEELDPKDIMDGLLIGDGTVHKADNNRVYLIIGKNDQDYFTSEIAPLLIEERPKNSPGYWLVRSNITSTELPLTYLRSVPDRFKFGNSKKVKGFLRGLYTANGSVVGGRATRITLKASSFKVIEDVQQMLSSIGIRSYYTVNKSKEVKFSNGNYVCRESYDLQITSDRWKFLEEIGFIQKYKVEKVSTIHDLDATRTSHKKPAYEIVEVESMGKCQVFDITVDAPEHTYWSGGLLVSNCGEILLENKELCNISEVFPVKCDSEVEFLKACEYATFYCSTVSLLPTHRSETNAVVQRNRRIGISNSGITELMEKISTTEMTRWLRAGYRVVEATNLRLANEAGVPPSIRTTTVKPSGTISQLVGVPSGVHFPQYDYAIRRMRIAAGSAIETILRAAGYVIEKDTYAENTSVVEFPIDQGRARKVTDVTVWEQALMLCMMQREWADNSVSVTLYFDNEKEGHQLEHLFSQIAPMVKSASALPHTKEGVYAQAPYSGITKEEFEERKSRLKKIDWSSYRGDGQDDKYCTGDTCEIKPRSKT